jgi:hypothetical protein
MFPHEIALASIGGNRFRGEGLSHTVYVEFAVSQQKVSGLTLEQGEGKPVRLQWNP